jgi:hypothetical protein
MRNWVRIRGIDVDNIIAWCRSLDITYSMHNPMTNPNTFDQDYDWLIEDEKERIMFLLKWSNKR